MEGGDGLPFIGSLMSLISYGEIRYEGTLFTIDMPNSTIALSNVRCFGTEGRRKEGEVPPSDQVFEYVVFKGSEIKELTVVQPPPAAPAPPPPPMGFQDPAIVSAGPPPPPPPPGAPSPWGPPPPPGQFGGPPPPGGPPPFGSSPWGPPPPPAGPGAPPHPLPGQPAPGPAPTVSVIPMGASNGNAGGLPPQQQRPGSYAHAAGGRGPPPQRGGRGGPRAPQHAPQHAQHVPRAPQHGGRGGGRGGQQQQIPRAPPVEVPKEEFNFEEALKRFNKVAVEKEAEEEHVPAAAAQTTYDKDDFFDKLSCDAMERMAIHDEGGRDDWRSKMAAQRKVDIETFGGVGRVGRNYRGRGRGRGYYGGRGRGGRGGGGHQQQAQPAA